MNKKILGVFVSLVVLAMLTTPVFAWPARRQKTAVKVELFNTDLGDNTPVGTIGPITLRNPTQTFLVTITKDGLIFNGDMEVNRWVVCVPKEDGKEIRYFWDYYKFTFDDEGGGFEGPGLVILDGFQMTFPFWERGWAQGIFRGTGAFEGETLNVGSNGWRDFSIPPSPIVWTGYWLE